jgi:hypothetical protein
LFFQKIMKGKHSQQFHFLKDLLILEFGSLAVLAEVSFAFMPFIRLQKDFLRLAAFEPFLSFDGFVVTAVCRFEPGFSLRYDSTPFLFKPPSGSFPSLRCHAGDFSVRYCLKESM